MPTPIPKPRGGKAIKPPKVGTSLLPRAWGPKPGQPYGKYGQGPLAPNRTGPKTSTSGNGGGNVTKTTTIAAAAPEDPIMAMFRSTLEQIRSVTPNVDEDAIRRPYRESQVVAGQIGQGEAAADAANSQRAQAGYTAAANEAQANAAKFGVTSGAGAGVVQPDNTNPLLAQQSQAQQNAAAGAASAWQQLLERAGATAVSKANMTRQSGIDQASESLAASIPSMRQNADQLKLSRDSMQANNKYLYASLDAAGKRAYLAAQTSKDNSIRSANTSTQNSIRTQTGANERNTASIEAANARNAATIKGASVRAKAATKTGVKGMSQVLTAITPGKVSDTRKVLGYYVNYVPDPNGINAGGTASRQFVKDPKTATPPDGYLPLAPGTIGDPKYAPAGASKPTGVTLAMWNKGVGILMTANGWDRATAMKAMQNISPKPPK